jgi:hypothetical protein
MSLGVAKRNSIKRITEITKRVIVIARRKPSEALIKRCSRRLVKVVIAPALQDTS